MLLEFWLDMCLPDYLKITCQDLNLVHIDVIELHTSEFLVFWHYLDFVSNFELRNEGKIKDDYN